MDELKKIINSQIESYYALTDVQVFPYFFDDKKPLFCFNQQICKSYKNGRCRKILDYSISFSKKIYETYLYECPSQLKLFVAPIIFKEDLIGGYVSQTFFLDDQDSYRDIIKIHFLNDIGSVKKISTANVRHLENILYILSKELIVNDYLRDLEKKQIILLQSKVQEEIQYLKSKNHLSTNNKYYQEQLNLLNQELKIEEFNTLKMNETLNKVLGEIFFAAGNKIELIKYRLSELLFILCRNDYRNENLKYLMLKELFEIQEMDGFYDFSYKMIKQFIRKKEKIRDSLDKIEEIKEFVYNHLEEDISLKDCAEYLYMNPSYLSRIFKLKTKENFTDFLNRLKINKSIDYLINQKMEIVKVASLLGYSDQSYFTKVFKRQIGITPKEYQKKYGKN